MVSAHIKMRKTRLNKIGKSEVAKCKQRIQSLLRDLVILRDSGCALRHFSETGQCGGYRNDGQLILQFDHLNSRSHSVSYADVRLGVCVCKRHHIFYKKQYPEQYMKFVRLHIGPERSALLDKVQADRKPYRMDLWNWEKQEYDLKQQLA